VARAKDYNRNRLYNGNAAYEVAWQEEQNQQEQVRRQAKKHRKLQRAYGVSPIAILGLALSCAMLVAVLISAITYTQVADQLVSCRNNVQTLMVENQNLTAEYEAAFNMNEINTYAQSVLGMSEPAGDQIDTIELLAEDSVAVCGGVGEKSVLSQVSGFINGVLDR